MTNLADLIADLRLNHEYCPKKVIIQAADALEAAQAEIDMHMRVATNAIDHVVTLKAEIEKLREVWIEDGVRASEDRGDLLKERDQAPPAPMRRFA